ncbi:MAG: hypothetical protein V8Q42_02030 [Anaerovoracaceae bacterium]
MICIEDTAQFYDMAVFNRCAETRNVLLTIECWQDVHQGGWFHPGELGTTASLMACSTAKTPRKMC